MAISTVFGYSSTAASNTDVAGNGITGSGSLSLGNDAIQNIMAQIASGVVGRGSDIATTGTLSFDGASTPSVIHDLTGTTTVTAITLTAGQWRLARAQGAFTLTASATLVVNGSTSTSYTTTAGDLLIVFGYTASTVRVWTITGGETAASTYLPLTGKTLTDSLNYAPTQTIASATTTDIGAATSNSVIVSGVTTITGLGTVAAGVVRDVLFSGALTLTHSGTALILPGAANITTAANDNATFRSLGSGNWVCLNYKRANGAPIIAAGTSGNLLTSDGTNWASTAPAAAGGMTLLGTLTPRSGATSSLTGIAAGYLKLYIELENITWSSSPKTLTLALSSTNGAAYGTALSIATSAAGGFNTINGIIEVYAISSTTQICPAVSYTVETGGAGTLVTTTALLVPNTAAVVNAIQFGPGTFDTLPAPGGTIRVYGVK